MDAEILAAEGIDIYAVERVLTVERYAWLSLSLDMAAVLTTDGQFEDCNVQWERVTGHAPQGLTGSYLIEHIHFDDRERVLAQMQRLITSDIGSTSLFFRFCCAGGDYRRLNWNVIFSPDHDCYFCMVKDASGMSGSDALAYRDALTGLANRMALEDTLPALVTRTCSLGVSVALLFMDLDGFKAVNDTFGHRAGDALLVQAAGRMERCVGDAGTVYRLGGDEFVAVLPGCTSGRADVLAIARDLVAALRQEYPLEREMVRTGVSVGIALAPEHGEDPAVLLDKADQAMYRVKSAGKNGFAVHGADEVCTA